MALKQKLRNRQSGFIVSAELALITTILVIGLIVGLVAVRDALVAELHDVAEAIGELDQAFTFEGVLDPITNAATQGSVFADEQDSTGGGVGNGYAGAAGDNNPIVFSLPPVDEN